MAEEPPRRRKPVVRKTTITTTCSKCGTWFSHTIRSDRYTPLVWPKPKDAARV